MGPAPLALRAPRLHGPARGTSRSRARGVGGTLTADASPHRTELTAESPLWVGAWWVGFLGAGAAAVLIAVPIFGYPRQLPGGCSRPRAVASCPTPARPPSYGAAQPPLGPPPHVLPLGSHERGQLRCGAGSTPLPVALGRAGGTHSPPAPCRLVPVAHAHCTPPCELSPLTGPGWGGAAARSRPLAPVHADIRVPQALSATRSWERPKRTS